LPCISTTTAAFGCTTPPCVGAAPSPSPDRPAYRPMVLADPDAHLRGRQGGSCVIHNWDCPNQVAPVHDPSSSSRQGEGEGGEEEYDEHSISVVTDPVGAPVIRRTAHISIGPRGRPLGALAQAATTLPTLPTPSLAASGPPLALPSNETVPLGSRTPLDLKSLCGNRLLCWLAHHVAPSGKGRAPGSWDSMVGPSW
jgi:hypothetical protein